MEQSSFFTIKIDKEIIEEIFPFNETIGTIELIPINEIEKCSINIIVPNQKNNICDSSTIYDNDNDYQKNENPIKKLSYRFYKGDAVLFCQIQNVAEVKLWLLTREL